MFFDAQARSDHPHDAPESTFLLPPRQSAHRARTIGLTALLCAMLAGCGGDDNEDRTPDDGPATPPPVVTPQDPTTPVVPVDPDVPTTSKALIISLDGATYAAVQQGIASGALPNLAALQIQMAYSGGMVESPGQQPTLDAPGWATLLTGTWGNRHRVISSAPEQVLRSATFFERLHTQSGAVSGAAVASSGLATLLSGDHAAGQLDTLSSCADSAVSTECVTREAVRMMQGRYTTVLAQYHAASDAALNYGQHASQYADTLVTLDKAIGNLVATSTERPGDRWLIAVTGNHGFSGNSQDDGLPLVPQSVTFIGMNQRANNAMLGMGAQVPQQISQLYGYASLADIAPTVLQFLSVTSDVSQHPMDGAPLLGQQPVSRLTTRVVDNNSSDVSIVLDWVAPAAGTITITRNGQVIASRLPAGTDTFHDNQLGQVLTEKGTYQLSYSVQVQDEQGSATRSILTHPVTYLPPIPLSASLIDGLVSYYPFGDTLPARDVMGNSVMAPASPDLPPAAGLVVPGPFAGSHALLVDTNYVTSAGLEGYRLSPNVGMNVSEGATPQFTLGFWFRTPVCVARSNVTILANKNYVSGGNAGVAIGLFSSSGNQCGIAFNIGSGAGVRADGPTYSQITVDRWVYLAFSVDGVSRTMNMTLFDPVTGQTNRAAVAKSTGSVDLSKLSAYPHWGIGDDGTNAYLMNKCNGTVSPPYVAGKCATAPTYQQMFADLAMWNRVLTDAELQSIFLSNKPLSTLTPN